MLNIIGLAMLIVIAALLIWSGFRAWRVRSSFLKWGGAGLAAVLAVAVLYARRAHDRGDGQAACAQSPGSGPQGRRRAPKRIGRGKTLVDGCCSACHSKTSTLTGGLDIGEDFPIPIESFVSSNLTPARAHVLHQRRQFERRR